MDYTETLNDPTLLLGFNELLRDPDVAVVKRTVRVFTNLFNHSLRLMSEDQISEHTLLRAWPYLSDIIDNIFDMFTSVENEGVLLILVKFLECSVDRHLNSDFTKYSEICHKSRDYVKRGLRALRDLVSTPYVGGSVFIVAVKAIIRLACHREDLYEPVTNLVDMLLTSLPPTLFHHNVRSFHKILQHNLFRLLKKSSCTKLKKKLIDMMVSAGASRKALAQWAPREIVPPKRKIPQQNIDDVILGRITPPEKRPKLEDTNNRDPIQQTVDELPTSKSINALVASPPKSSSLDFLTSLIPKPLSDGKEEKRIYDHLSLEKVCSLIVTNLHSMPDAMPDTFPKDFSEKTVVSENLNIMRSHLAGMLVSLFSVEQCNLLSSDNTFASVVSTTTDTRSPPRSVEKVVNFSANDVDMRSIATASRDVQDVDMRVVHEGPRQIESKPPTPPFVSEPRHKTVQQPTPSDVDCKTKRDSFKPETKTDRETVTIYKIDDNIIKEDIGIKPNSPREHSAPEQDASKISSNIESDTTRVGARIDPRLRNKASSTRETPSPEIHASPAAVISEPTSIIPTRNDPRLMNRAIPSPPRVAMKEDFRRDPRVAIGNTRARDMRIGEQNLMGQENYILHTNNNIVGREFINNTSHNMSFQNNTPRHMLPNAPYPGTAQMNMDHPNQFQHKMRDPRSFRPRFEQHSRPNNPRMYANYNNIGPMNNFNNSYPYCPQGRFQQL